ncbi:GNAT family N-acetyltransferase [Marinococcus luteus]|uniref:GNAT family N-acetyltransferase n=1 Tax=Marinococcus luteus TaxID=1122204 RepID=UPI002ACCBB69|nr:GNAT family N-acetyltransferase [Marinococcus luteus]MDZ5784410.1 GNAT family N-acetyltransferase [Marinococcus luteus]
MEIKHYDNRFTAEQDSKVIGDISFFEEGEQSIVIDSTKVIDEEQGKGVGKELVRNVVEKAKAENKTIVPRCPYAEETIKENDDFKQVLETQ